MQNQNINSTNDSASFGLSASKYLEQMELEEWIDRYTTRKANKHTYFWYCNHDKTWKLESN